MSAERDVAQALAKRLNWEPPHHDDYPGSIPDHAWHHWRVFEPLALRPVVWRKVDPASWREKHAADWAPAFEAVIDGQRYLLVQHDWHGFPDPPEWALHVMDRQAFATRCLDCFDEWPEAWTK